MGLTLGYHRLAGLSSNQACLHKLESHSTVVTLQFSNQTAVNQFLKQLDGLVLVEFSLFILYYSLC